MANIEIAYQVAYQKIIKKGIIWNW